MGRWTQPVLAKSDRQACAQCGQEFSGRKRRYCGEACRLKSPRRGKRLQCKGCGVDFMSRRAGNAYCTSACANRSQVRPPPESLVVDCWQCGLWFEARPGRKMMFCCRSCAFAYKGANADKNQPKTIRYSACKQCGCQFRSSGTSRQCCTKDCRRRLDAARQLVAYRERLAKPKKSVVCLVCSKTFLSAYPHACYCTRRCAKTVERRTANAKRNALLRYRKQVITHGERINPFKVFARDGWTCQLCHKKVKRGALSPHPLAPVMDHIVPLRPLDPSQPPGQHVMANVQCAHFICNSKRSNCGPAQMRLFG